MLSAVSILTAKNQASNALSAFHDRWKSDANVTDKWFSVQAGQTPPDKAIDVVAALTQHKDFVWKTPNRYRSLLGGFAFGNHAGFHRADGAGYALYTDWLLKLDPLNPQTTARMTTAFEAWTRYDEGRKALMKTQLERIAGTENLSRDTTEMISRILSA